MVDNNTAKRNCTIDLIKGFAIILVLITHYSWTDEQRKLFVFPFVINMAIPVFMVITGYVYSLSLSKQGINHIEDAFPMKMILKRIVRYALPFYAVIIWSLFDPHFQRLSLLELLRWAIDGADGPGSYYFPVMIQIVFVFPLVYFLINKKEGKGLLIAFIANSVYELLAWSYGMPTTCYRLLMFRYVFLIAVGVYAFKGYKLKLWQSILTAIIGAAFIIIVVYFDYVPRIVNSDWSTTNFISSMLIVPLMIWILQNHKNIRVMFLLPIEIIGRASYHIYLVQMVYYLWYYYEFQRIVSTWYIHLILGIVICLVLGVVWYYVDKPIQKVIGSIISGMTDTQQQK